MKKPTKKAERKSDFDKAFDKIAYEKEYTLQSIGRVRGIFSKYDDSYIGGQRSDLSPLIKHGIVQKLQSVSGIKGRTCQVGFNPVKKSWYGWGKFMGSFKIGSCAQEFMVDGGFVHGTKEHRSYLKKYKRFIDGDHAKTLEDCRQLAIMFAISAE